MATLGGRLRETAERNALLQSYVAISEGIPGKHFDQINSDRVIPAGADRQFLGYDLTTYDLACGDAKTWHEIAQRFVTRRVNLKLRFLGTAKLREAFFPPTNSGRPRTFLEEFVVPLNSRGIFSSDSKSA